MSLGGLAIAIGMMVDGTIVIVENVDRMLREATPDASRARDRAPCRAEVARPIVFAISIIIIVFLPLFTLQGVEGKTFRPLAYTVALAMVGSLVFALVLAPVLASLLMRRPETGGLRPSRANGVGSFDAAALRPARRVLRAGAARRRRRGRWRCSSWARFVFPRLGSEFTPRLQEGTLVVRLTMAPSISLPRARASRSDR